LLYDAFGKTFSYVPSLHVSLFSDATLDNSLILTFQFKRDLQIVNTLFDQVEQHYHISGKPLHVADPTKSLFRIMDVAEFEAMDDRDLQDIHARQHVLVRGPSKGSYQFDREAMLTLTDPGVVICVHGA
jgi:hypothetical protein